MGEAKRRKKLDPTYGKPKFNFLEHIFSDPILKQIAFVFSRSKVEYRKVSQLPCGENIMRSGRALRFLPQTLDEYCFLCNHYLELCDFIQLIEDKQKPDFLVVDQPSQYGDSFFIVLDGRKTYSSTEKEEIAISR